MSLAQVRSIALVCLTLFFVIKSDRSLHPTTECELNMSSILNNDDNPAFTVRRTADASRSQSSYESSSRKVDSPPTQPSWANYQAHQPPATSYPASSNAPYPAAGGSPPYLYTAVHYHRYAFPYEDKRMPWIQSNRGLSSPSSLTPSMAALYAPSTTATGEPPTKKNKYPCPYAASHACTATFTTSGHAARHGKKHVGEKSVHCPVCKKAFTRKDNMIQHRRTHRSHTDKPASSPTVEL